MRWLNRDCFIAAILTSCAFKLADVTESRQEAACSSINSFVERYSESKTSLWAFCSFASAVRAASCADNTVFFKK